MTDYKNLNLIHNLIQKPLINSFKKYNLKKIKTKFYLLRKVGKILLKNLKINNKKKVILIITKLQKPIKMNNNYKNLHQTIIK